MAGARLLVGLALLLVGLVIMSMTLGEAGFQKDAIDGCYYRQPPPEAGVSGSAISNVEADWQLLPLGVRCLYEGPQGQTIVVSDIKLRHTLAAASGGLLMVLGICLPFLRRRRQPQA